MLAAEHNQQLTVFISYSRLDLYIADALVDALEQKGFQVLIDRRDLPYGEEWQGELEDFIRQSDTVVWLVSPDSIESDWCNWEVALVGELKKRLIPIKIRDLDLSRLPKAIGKIHLLPAEGIFEFGSHLQTLIDVLNTDRSWLKDATRLADRARQWSAKERDSGLILRGAALRDAEEWKRRQPANAPAPSSEVLELILASRQGATRRQRYWVGGSLAVAIGAIGLALFAYTQQVVAEQNEVRAKGQEKLAKLREQQAERKGREIHSLIVGVVGELERPWPLDTLSPDYRHLARLPLAKKLRGSEFEVTPEALELLIQSNRFQPGLFAGKLVVALRGAQFASDAKSESGSLLRLKDVRPDHKSMKSIIIVYDRNSRILTGFAGATVPSIKFLVRSNTQQGSGANLMLTGTYQYVVRAIFLSRAFRPGNLAMKNDASVVVRRTVDRSFEIVDRVSLGNPRNLIHPSYFREEGRFSSSGSIVISGSQERSSPFSFTGRFADFRQAIGLNMGPTLSSDHGKEIGLIILTGLDVAIATALIQKEADVAPKDKATYLNRIRFGSTGDAVVRLQQALGVPADGRVGAKTIQALADLQSRELGWWDAVYTPQMDRIFDFCVFDLEDCASFEPQR